MNSESKKITGLFVKILKQDPDKWALMSFKEDESNKIMTIYSTGIAPKLRTYYEIELAPNEGKYKNNFKLLKYIPIAKPQKEINWEEFYSKNIAGIGKKSAEKIYKTLGTKLWSLLNNVEENKGELLEVLTESQLNSFVKFYENKNNKESVISLLENSHESINRSKFFYENNLVDLYQKLLKIWEQEPQKDFVEYYTHNNPYLLYFRYNIKLEDVDQFALDLNWSLLSEYRVKAYIKNIMTILENKNSTIVPLTDLCKEMYSVFGVEPNQLNELVSREIESGFILINVIDNVNYCSLRTTYLKEQNIKLTLKKLTKTPTMLLNSLDSNSLKNLSKDQKTAYDNFLLNNVSVITGGPGTGKTYLIQKIYQTLQENNLKNQEDFAILAPTGRAASNVSFKICAKVRTIHSFLKISNDEEEVPQDNDQEKIKVLIIDEFSMVNLNIFDKLINVCPNLEKIILIGDVDQLPAIGPGNLLEDIINSNVFATTYLNEYFRSDSTEIWTHFTAIKQGTLALFSKDHVEHIISDPENFVDDLVDLYAERLKQRSLDELIILCPTYKGNDGLISINNKIQEKINPNGKVVHKYKRNGQQVNFKINDKVIQLENRPEDEISNGDFGYIKDVTQTDPRTKIIKILFNSGDKDKIVEYTESEFNQQVALGYGVTVHKFQGSEIEEVIFTVNNSYFFMLSQKMLYTATSRPKKRLFIITPGSEIYKKAQQNGIKNKEEVLTNLKLILRS